MKRGFAVAVGAILLVLSLCGCSSMKKGGDTYQGTVSEAAYASSEGAAEAFVREELSGDEGECKLVRFKSEKTLSKEEAEEMFPALSPLSAEKGDVEYVRGQGESETMPLYLVREEKGYRYFTPPQRSGERLTKSYYRSVMDRQAYLNCTVETTYNMQLASVSALYYQLLKFSEGFAYFKQDLPGAFKVDFYVQEQGERLKIFTKHPENDDGKYYDIDRFSGYDMVISRGGKTTSISSLESVSDIVGLMFENNFDHSYYQKTDYGFCLPNENYRALVKDLLSLASDEADEFEAVWNEYQMYARADYYVSEGRLSSSTVQVTACGDWGIFAVTVKQNFHSFGTTKVTLPEVEGAYE